MSVGFKDEPKPPPVLDRYVFTVALCAGIFAAIRLARLSDSELNIARLKTVVEQSVRISKTILDEAMRLASR